MKHLILAFLAVLLTPFVSGGPALAQNYIGLSGGLMSYEDGQTDLDSQGFTVFAGGQFDPLLAVEFSYTMLSSVEINKKDYKASVMALSGVLRSPGEGFEPFLRLGLARGDASIASVGSNAQPYDEEKDGLIFGLGADMSLNYNSSIRVEYAETDIDGASSSRFSIGTIYRF